MVTYTGGRRASPRDNASWLRGQVGRFALFGLLVGSAGCPGGRDGSASGVDAGAPAAAAEAEGQALARAEDAAKLLGKRLRERLADAQNLGPERAIQVCADEAQAITAAVRTESGLALGRASTRLRNERDAGPGWVTTWLATQGERKAEGAPAVRAVQTTPTGKVARVLLPIGIEATCLRCHGDRDQLMPGVRAVLDARYPGDRATGYAIGDLRGALWAEAPVR